MLLSEEQALAEGLGLAARDRKTEIQQITDTFRSQKNVKHTGPRTKTAPLVSQTKPWTANPGNRMDQHAGEETNDPLLMLHQTLLHSMHCNDEGVEAAGVSKRQTAMENRKKSPTAHQQKAEHATALLDLHHVRACTCTLVRVGARTVLCHACWRSTSTAQHAI